MCIKPAINVRLKNCTISMIKEINCLPALCESDMTELCRVWQRLNVKAFNSHKRKVHCKENDKGRQSCCCPFCDRKFWDRYHLQRHLTVHRC